ncbi:type II toxin-antitoxin system antitoxin DNA ADP-ribosyl glycohydrolase DarG [Rubrimonas cliftonensis]|uniref:O-acetyl-ADP-ribose deacetylase (Regulator of RNase III), contains Macro domain n=1 Tax=Rubrimonas cliftonensis TaxID=89524 RepID=A0A1H3Z1I3_9RHOB|nr:macro domain-containing protein [Rubrimonas cliftonensis]SEA17288.1 O-acetyl-ADP-ribose deacetylase (regulator of RNase III), contains Macro domain [Rubrimonas cliftonensis]
MVFPMIDYRAGNLLDADAEALVNTVNTVGVSGKGVALMFKEAFPENFRAYAAACRAGDIAPGGLFVTERRDMLGPRWIINFATKDHWRSPSRLEWIEAGLADLRREIAARGIRSIAIPPLGAGNGGLDWTDVKPLITEALGDMDVAVAVFEPSDSYRNVVKRRGVEKLTPARALMSEMIARYEILGFDCSILEAQKLAWFLSVASRSLRLDDPIDGRFAPDRYGPYSDRVRHLLDSLDGSYLTCERRVAEARPFDPIRFRHDRRDRVTAFLTTEAAATLRPALDRVTAIIDGFQSPHGMELLATVDWLRRKEGVEMKAQPMTEAIGAWPGPEGSAARKAGIFHRDHIETAIDHLIATDPI